MSESALALDAEAIAEYLATHPDFFVGREDLLLSLRLPHPTSGAISLIEHQAIRLRERVSQLEKTLHELHTLAYTNERLALRMHQLALALLAAHSPCEVIEITRTRLCSDFDLAGVLIGLEDEHPLATPCLSSSIDAAWPGLFALKHPQMPRTNAPLRELLLAHGLPETASVAAIPLRGEAFRGAMLLVKREPYGFSPDMGTLFLEQIGDLVSTALAHAR